MSANEDHGWMIERRSASRHPVQRIAHLLYTALIDAEQDSPVLIGYTRDISETGLSLIVPIGEYDLPEVGSLLNIKLSLPVGVVEMDASVVRYQLLMEGHLLGVVITSISDTHRKVYTEYVDTLS